MAVNLAQAGLSCITFDPEAANTAQSGVLTAATLYLNRVSFEQGGSLLPASIYVGIATAGSVCTGTFCAVYNCSTLSTPEVGALSPIAAGTRLAITADLGATPAAGWAPQALTWLPGFGELPTGDYWLAFCCASATTVPAVAGAGVTANVLLPNLGLTLGNLRYAVNGATAAATLTIASNTSAAARPLLMGLAA